MITLLAYGMIAVFMTAIMTRALSALIALILVPAIFAVAAGFLPGLPDMIIDGLKSIAPTGVLLLFAILYFGLMIDVGLFDPIVRLVVRLCHGDPLRVIVGSTLLSAIISLDGDGSTTYLLCITAMLPLHRKLGINPLILPAVTMLPNSIMNIAPWGGPTARVVAALHLDSGQVFLPLIPAIAVAFVVTVGIAWYLGLKERKRLGKIDFVYTGPKVSERSLIDEDRILPPREQRDVPAWRQTFNIILTVVLMVLLVLNIAPLAILFMFAFAVAITVNFPKLSEQRERLAAHSGSAMAVVSVIFAAGVFTGILKGTGMTEALAQSIVWLIPAAHGNLLPVMTALISGPFTFFLSNDAFYFGVVPVLAEAGRAYGIAPEVIARASLIGQPLHQLSPLVAAGYVLIGLAEVELGDHQRFSIKWAVLLAFLMLLAALLTGAVTLF
ncbi:CitMHS family transporter [Rhizobium mesosinicum]|uniref:Citrate transporter n=1 Tax=Rhizobium mesosinicum TaxID=335017 RepID=A0ABS7GQZ2_9HYPH|nr:citrate transporter [Rhizobium mesosinicum]